MSRVAGQRTSTGTPVRILDVLETDGGWLTAEGIALMLNVSLGTVSRALWRLRSTGEVEHRTVPLAAKLGRPATTYSGNGCSSRLDQRSEWRFT
jgi:predicted transcriptional regulator